MRKLIILAVWLFCVTGIFARQSPAAPPVAHRGHDPRGFYQEYQEVYPLAGAIAQSNVRCILADKAGSIFITTEAGVYRKLPGDRLFSPLPMADSDQGPAYALALDTAGGVWIGNWKGVYRYFRDSLKRIPGTVGPMSVLCTAREGIYGIGPGGVFWMTPENGRRINYPLPRSVRSAVSDGKGGIWAASDVGLYHASPTGTQHYYNTRWLLSAALKGLATGPRGELWAAGLGGVSVLEGNKHPRFIGPSQGCPSIHTSCVKRSPEGVMWVGSRVGVVRFNPDGTHSLLFSRRWLADDQVNDLCFDDQGDAWVATQQGVSVIRKKWMTLEEKQDYFYRVLMARHMRAPWTAGQCHLPVAGDTTRWEPQDDDNDGEYTGNYLAMESFRYAATKNPDAREKARKAFHFLMQLQEITGGDGYFARSMVPLSWAGRVHDPNRRYTAQELADELVGEPRFKPVEVRWHKSADGQWLWKGDASSDEWCGHMMGYFFYYRLAADEAEKILVRRHITSLADHLIAHEFNMTDPDGQHTRWSVWSPASLNRDPEWAPDRAQNSLELLGFLKLAYYCSGDNKYQQHYLHLIKAEHYLDNAAQIVRQNPAWFIYFDATLQAYIYPILLQCEKDPRLLAVYRQLADRWIQVRKKDQNPLISYLYSYGRGRKITPKASLDFLRDTPLDLVDWDIDHSKREDIRLTHAPVLNEWQLETVPPPAIRSTVRWDKNPWGLVRGAPDTEMEPVFWLLPYWMGRTLRMIP